MISNEYTKLFRNEPMTIRDRASNLMKFLQSSSISTEDHWIEKRSIISSSLQHRVLDLTKHTEFPYLSNPSLDQNQTMQELLQQVISHSPLIYQQRMLQGIGNMSVHIYNTHLTNSFKPQPMFDHDGNCSLLHMIVVIQTGQLSKDSFLKTQASSTSATFTSIHNLALIIDNKTQITYPSVEKGKLVVIEMPLLYSVLPNNSLTLSQHDQTILWRGLMRKPFLNTFGYSSCFKPSKKESGRNSPTKRPTSPVNQWSSKTFEDPMKDQCESCMNFIPIESECCPLCNDRLVPIPTIIQSRKKGIWISMV